MFCSNLFAMLIDQTKQEYRNLNIYAINDYLTHTHGYSLNTLQRPACVHLCCTYRHIGLEQVFISHVAEAVAHCVAHPELNKKGDAAVYGMTSSLPPGPVKEILRVYNDVVLDT